jgi:hypothetical protein
LTRRRERHSMLSSFFVSSGVALGLGIFAALMVAVMVGAAFIAFVGPREQSTVLDWERYRGVALWLALPAGGVTALVTLLWFAPLFRRRALVRDSEHGFRRSAQW